MACADQASTVEMHAEDGGMPADTRNVSDLSGGGGDVSVDADVMSGPKAA